MSYSKNSWSTGDTITATKLNHLEDGVYNTDAAATAAGPLLVPFTAEIDEQGNITLSTEADYATTRAAALAGRTVIANVTVADMTTRFPLWGINDTDLFFSGVIMPDSEGTEAMFQNIYWSAVTVLFRSKSIPYAT